MQARRLNKIINPVSVLDELIMELSYIKNRSPFSKTILEKGLELIARFLANEDESLQEVVEEKSRFNAYQGNIYYNFNNYNIGEYSDELTKAKEYIKTLISKPTDFDPIKIENIQELLLKVSLPIWKEQVSNLKPNQSKLIEL